MTTGSKINIEVFKTVTKAIAQSNTLDIMASHLAQLLVGTLGIKACAIYALDPESGELEPLASFGLSMKYVGKGPLLAAKSIAECLSGTPVIVPDVSSSDRIQYPAEAMKEDINSIASIPITTAGSVLGTLRLYHGERWDPSDEDVDSLMLLAEFIGLAMNYTTLVRAIYAMDEIIHQGLPQSLSPDPDRYS